jgi:hypothetical protein
VRGISHIFFFARAGKILMALGWRGGYPGKSAQNIAATRVRGKIIDVKAVRRKGPVGERCVDARDSCEHVPIWHS